MPTNGSLNHGSGTTVAHNATEYTAAAAQSSENGSDVNLIRWYLAEQQAKAAQQQTTDRQAFNAQQPVQSNNAQQQQTNPQQQVQSNTPQNQWTDPQQQVQGNIPQNQWANPQQQAQDPPAPQQPQQPLPPHVAIANHIRPFANQVALQPGQYAVAPKGSDADGYTSFVQGQEYMAENNVPRRLGYLEQNPEESRKSLARVAALTDEKGNAITGRDGRTHLRDLPILPLHISAAVEGWRMWAWVLYDTRVQIDDIIQRMWVKQTRKQTLTKRMDDWRRVHGGFGTNPREARPRHPIPGFIVSSKEDMKIMDRIYPLGQVSGVQSEESNKIYLNTVWKFVFDEHGGIGVQQDNGTPIWPLPPRHDDAAQRAWRAVQKRQQLNQNAVAAGSTAGAHELAWEVWARQNPAVAWGRDNNQTKRIATVQARRQQSGATTPAGSSTGTTPAGPSTATTPAGPSTATTPAGPSTATTPAGPSAATTPADTGADHGNDADEEAGTYAPLQHNRDSESPPGALPGKARKVHRGQTASAPAPAPKRRRTAAPSTGTGHGRGHGRGSRPGSSAGTRARSGAGTPVNDAAQFFGPPPVHPGGALAAHGSAPTGYGEHAYPPGAGGPQAPGPGLSNFQSHLYSLDTGIFQNADDDAMSITYDGPATVFSPTTTAGPSDFQSNPHPFGPQAFQNADNEGMSFNNEPAPAFPPTAAPDSERRDMGLGPAFRPTGDGQHAYPPVARGSQAPVPGPSNFQSHPHAFDSRAFQNADDNGMSFNNNELAPAFPPTNAPGPSNFQSHPQPFNSFQNANNEGMSFNNNEPAPAFPPPTTPSSESRYIPIDPALEQLFPPLPPPQQPPPQLQPGFIPRPPPAFTPRLPPTQEEPSTTSSPPGRLPQPIRTPARDRTIRNPLSAASAADPIFAAGQQQIGTHLPAPQTPGERQEQNQLLEQALAAQRAGLPGTGTEAEQRRPAQQARHFAALAEAGRREAEHMAAHRRTAAEMADLYMDYGDRRQLDLLVRYIEAHGLGGDHEIRGQLDRVAARGLRFLGLVLREPELSDLKLHTLKLHALKPHNPALQDLLVLDLVVHCLAPLVPLVIINRFPDGQPAPYFSTIVDAALNRGGIACVEDLADTYMWRHQVRNVLHAETLNPTVRFRTAVILSSVLGDQIDRLRRQGYQIDDLSTPIGEELLSDDNIQRYGMLGGQNHEGHDARITYINTVIVRLRQIWSFLYPEDYAEGRSPPASAAIDAPLYTTDQVGDMFDRWDEKEAARKGEERGRGNGEDGEDGGSWDGMGKGKGRAE
ncbi:hypothetical protein SLS56_003612 [Neofusicoccum ribis]|uniref:Uncharacterized protein n=1 Tax=Neofusicoccum ribis TaxID=45134 RepID=A0ABR3SYV9_9PEZI